MVDTASLLRLPPAGALDAARGGLGAILDAIDPAPDRDCYELIDVVSRTHYLVWPSPEDDEHAQFHRRRLAETGIGAGRGRAHIALMQSGLVEALARWFSIPTQIVRTFLASNARSFVIAGGFPTAVYRSGGCAHVDFSRINDVDVFVINGTSFDSVRRAWLSLIRHQVVEGDGPQTITTSYVTPSLCEISAGEGCPRIQINAVCATARDASDVIMSFDRASCAFAYDPSQDAIVSTRDAIDAHAAGREPVDLVVGSGDAIACLRVGARDAKYRSLYDVEVSWPPWADSISAFLRTKTLRHALEEIESVALAVRALKNARVAVDRTLASARFEVEVIETLASAPRGLVSTVAVRRVLAPALEGIQDAVGANAQFYLHGIADKGVHGAFVSRTFGRACRAIGSRMPALDVVLADAFEWRTISKRLVQCCVAFRRDISR